MKLIIIGPMASGKSVVGKKLSKRMGLDFFDTDKQIEKIAGARISWIFDVEGEEKFRERVEGIDPGAPNNPKIGKKFLITTIITSIIFIVIYYLVSFNLLNLREFLQ